MHPQRFIRPIYELRTTPSALIEGSAGSISNTRKRFTGGGQQTNIKCSAQTIWLLCVPCAAVTNILFNVLFLLCVRL